MMMMVKMVLNSLSCISRCCRTLRQFSLPLLSSFTRFFHLCLSSFALNLFFFIFISSSSSNARVCCCSTPTSIRCFEFVVSFLLRMYVCVCVWWSSYVYVLVCSFVFVCILRDGCFSTLCHYHPSIFCQDIWMGWIGFFFFFIFVSVEFFFSYWTRLFFLAHLLLKTQTVICSLNFLVLLLLLLRYYVCDARKLFLFFYTTHTHIVDKAFFFSEPDCACHPTNSVVLVLRLMLASRVDFAMTFKLKWFHRDIKKNIHIPYWWMLRRVIDRDQEWKKNLLYHFLNEKKGMQYVDVEMVWFIYTFKKKRQLQKKTQLYKIWTMRFLWTQSI